MGVIHKGITASIVELINKAQGNSANQLNGKRRKKIPTSYGIRDPWTYTIGHRINEDQVKWRNNKIPEFHTYSGFRKKAFMASPFPVTFSTMLITFFSKPSQAFSSSSFRNRSSPTIAEDSEPCCVLLNESP